MCVFSSHIFLATDPPFEARRALHFAVYLEEQHLFSVFSVQLYNRKTKQRRHGTNTSYGQVPIMTHGQVVFKKNTPIS